VRTFQGDKPSITAAAERGPQGKRADAADSYDQRGVIHFVSLDRIAFTSGSALIQ
jgi:hypothetical protein